MWLRIHGGCAAGLATCSGVRGLLHDPEVLFLDEPSIGIDPIGARELRETVRNLVALDKTVLLTTHYMFEADELCDRIAVIRDGEIVAEGTPDELKERASAGRVVEIETYGIGPATVDNVSAVAGVRGVAVEERGQMQILLVHAEARADVTPDVLKRLGDARVGRVTTREPTLEDAYVELVTAT
jgi:ABC-2 type transport system ATP-binding protein